MGGRWILGSGVALALACPAGASALAPRIAIGSQGYSGNRAAVAVDGTGAADIAYEPSGSATGDTIDFCQITAGSTGCTPVVLAPPAPAELLSDPQIIASGTSIYVFAFDQATDAALHGVDEWISTDGGSTFTAVAHAVSTGFPLATAIPLLSGEVGFGHPGYGGNPFFDANTLEDPGVPSGTEATLHPASGTYQIGNLPIAFASQLSGTTGLLMVSEANSTTGCPGEQSLVYAYAPIDATTTTDALSGGSGDPWGPEDQVDCASTDPATAGGPAGLGLLETSEPPSAPAAIEYRRFTAPGTFASPATVAPGTSVDDSLGQDAAGGIYATWSNNNGLQLAYSSDGGATWMTGSIEPADGSGTKTANDPISAVGTTGAGWAVYNLAGTEYAQPFTAADVAPATIPAPTPVKPAVSTAPAITGTPAVGQTLTCNAGNWSGSPSFTYVWQRDGGVLAGATGPTHLVATLDAGAQLACTVIASNAVGSAGATSAIVTVTRPPVAHCPTPGGELAGTSLGLAHLGESRRALTSAGRHVRITPRRGSDTFCLNPGTISAGLPSPGSLAGAGRGSTRLYRHVAWITTTTPSYALDGIRTGEPFSSVLLAGRRSVTVTVGATLWYFVIGGPSTGLIKVSGGAVTEVGIASSAVTKTPAARARLARGLV